MKNRVAFLPVPLASQGGEIRAQFGPRAIDHLRQGFITQALKQGTVAADAAAIEYRDVKFWIVPLKFVALRHEAMSWSHAQAQVPQRPANRLRGFAKTALDAGVLPQK